MSINWIIFVTPLLLLIYRIYFCISKLSSYHSLFYWPAICFFSYSPYPKSSNPSMKSSIAPVLRLVRRLVRRSFSEVGSLGEVGLWRRNQKQQFPSTPQFSILNSQFSSSANDIPWALGRDTLHASRDTKYYSLSFPQFLNFYLSFCYLIFNFWFPSHPPPSNNHLPWTPDP